MMCLLLVVILSRLHESVCDPRCVISSSHYPTLPYTTLHYPTLPYTTLHYPTLPYTTLHYPTLPYTTLCCVCYLLQH
jgi:hypothetical protein